MAETIRKYCLAAIIALIGVLITSIILVYLMRWIATPFFWIYIVLMLLTCLIGKIQFSNTIHFKAKYGKNSILNLINSIISMKPCI